VPEYDETTWSARTWLTFVAQRISVAVQLSMAQEAAEALGLCRWRPILVRGERVPRWAFGLSSALAQLASVCRR